MAVAVRQHWIIGTLILLTVVGCDSDKKPKQSTSTVADASSETPTDNFSYDETAEFNLDSDAFLSSETKEDYHVATVYFEGGTGKNCAKWDVTISGEDIKLARGSQLKAEDQTRLSEDTPGELHGSFETRGTIPGIRFVVKRESIVTFIGSQSYCKSSDKADYSVQENVQKSKLHEIFRGVDVKGIGFITLKFSDEKSPESVAKIKEQMAGPGASPEADPAATDGTATDTAQDNASDTEANSQAPAPTPTP